MQDPVPTPIARILAQLTTKQVLICLVCLAILTGEISSAQLLFQHDYYFSHSSEYLSLGSKSIIQLIQSAFPL